MSKQVLVVEKRNLFQIVGGYFEGFKKLEPSIIEELEKASLWLNKDQAEKDPTFKQLIGYCTLMGPDKKIFAYQRATEDVKYQEKRLQGKWSVGIGGHVEPTDGDKNRILSSIKREIQEEVEIYGRVEKIHLIGGINDDSNSVGMVHFGLWILATISGNATPNDKAIAFGGMMSIATTKEIFLDANVENWSNICLHHLSA